MKRITMILTALVLSFTMTLNVSAAPSKSQRRIAYTLKNLGVDANKQKQLTPLLTQYLNDKKAATKRYDDMKKKYEVAIKKGTLTDGQAKELLEAKWDCDARELNVKKTYTVKLATVLPMKKVYKCFSLINDKMSKVDGTKQGKEDDDD